MPDKKSSSTSILEKIAAKVRGKKPTATTTSTSAPVPETKTQVPSTPSTSVMSEGIYRQHPTYTQINSELTEALNTLFPHLIKSMDSDRTLLFVTSFKDYIDKNGLTVENLVAQINAMQGSLFDDKRSGEKFKTTIESLKKQEEGLKQAAVNQPDGKKTSSTNYAPMPADTKQQARHQPPSPTAQKPKTSEEYGVMPTTRPPITQGYKSTAAAAESSIYQSPSLTPATSPTLFKSQPTYVPLPQTAMKNRIQQLVELVKTFQPSLSQGPTYGLTVPKVFATCLDELKSTNEISEEQYNKLNPQFMTLAHAEGEDVKNIKDNIIKILSESRLTPSSQPK